MNETRLPDRLHDLASDMPVELERSGRRTLRRARARRAATAFVGVAAAAAIVVGGVAVLRVAAPNDRESILGNTGTPTPSPTASVLVPAPDLAGFPGLWPETNDVMLADAQAAVDEGHTPLRLDPEQTAVMLTTNLFGWEYDDVRPSTVSSTGSTAVVDVWNVRIPEGVPPISIELAQLGRTGPTGIWSVVRVTSALFDEALGVTVPSDATGVVTVTGRVPQFPVDVIRYYVLRGPTVDREMPHGEATIDGDAFDFSWPVAPNGLDEAVLWILVADEEHTLGALAVSLDQTADVPTPEPTAGASPEIEGVPVTAAVAEMRDAIQFAALNHDLEALRGLLDPMTFAYNFGDGSDPTPEWREDPAPLDTLAKILSLPPTIRDVEGLGEIYVFPYFADEDLSLLDARELDMLENIGITQEMVQEMIDADTGYLGPRTVIHADGRWLSYTTGGD